jgi:hypothetical protein
MVDERASGDDNHGIEAPAGWGDEPVSEFIRTADRNGWATFVHYRVLWERFKASRPPTGEPSTRCTIQEHGWQVSSCSGRTVLISPESGLPLARRFLKPTWFCVDVIKLGQGL